MKILCIGAGAIGMYAGGSLDLTGNDVGFLVKPGQVSALSENGIQISYKKIQKKVEKPLLSTDLGMMISKGYDTLLIAVKSYDTEQILNNISPFKDRVKCCVCLQNGVDNEIGLINLLGKEKVIYASVASAIRKKSQTQVVIEKNRGIGLSGQCDHLDKVQREFKRSGLKPKIYHSPLSMKWSKLISNLFSNATSAILDMSPAEVYSHKQMVKIEIMQIKEALNVVNALGLEMIDLPGIPLRSLTWAIQFMPDFVVIILLQLFVGGGRGNKLPSLLEAFRKNSMKTEIEFLNGAVSKYAEIYSIDAPVNKGLTEILNKIAKNPEQRQKFSKSPDYLIEKLNKFV